MAPVDAQPPNRAVHWPRLCAVVGATHADHGRGEGGAGAAAVPRRPTAQALRLLGLPEVQVRGEGRGAGLRTWCMAGRRHGVHGQSPVVLFCMWTCASATIRPALLALQGGVRSSAVWLLLLVRQGGGAALQPLECCTQVGWSTGCAVERGLRLSSIKLPSAVRPERFPSGLGLIGC